jgi:TRAP transporter 4TM/12TM fusion protein
MRARLAGLRPAPAIAATIGLFLALLAIYTAAFGLFNDVFHRGLVLGLSAIAIVLAEPLAARRADATRHARALLWSVDIAMAVAWGFAIYWFFAVQDELWGGLYEFEPLDLVFAGIAVATLIELTRRTAGAPLAVVAVLGMLYALFGAYLPWIFYHPGYSLEETMRTVWYSFDGVFGLPVAVVGGKIFIFFVFGATLQGTGAGDVLLKMSSALTGRLRGGPAHAAIVASALFGTISGSVAANVVGTGVFTIPMIKKRGFPAAFAGAVEAGASTGGQFMPPVMGAAAFLMAELLGMPYLTIAVAALLPALFYYGSLFAAVSVEAIRRGIHATPPAERERLTGDDWLRSLMFFVPVAVIIATLLSGRSVSVAGLAAVLSTIVMALALNPALRADPARLISALMRGGLAGAKIMVAVGTIGILIGVMNLTGLGIQISNTILDLGDGSLFVSLLLTMVACLILGMGMPTLPAYLIIVLIMGPAIEKLGISALTTHLFVLYFGVLSAITPPVAIAGYAAAPIAGSKPVETAVTAIRLALIGFVIPFVFVFNPSLLIVETFDAWALVWISLRLGLAIWLFATGFAGVEKTAIAMWTRPVRIALGGLVLVSDIWISGAAIMAGAALIVSARLRVGPAVPVGAKSSG